jgi:hypothetical protein
MLIGITERRFGIVKILHFVRHTESMELQRILTARPFVLRSTWLGGSLDTPDHSNQTKACVIALHYANVVRFIPCLKRKIRYLFKKRLSTYFDIELAFDIRCLCYATAPFFFNIEGVTTIKT